MRYPLSFLLAISLFTTGFAQSNQQVLDFFQGGGAELVCLLAHPTNDYVNASLEQGYGGNLILTVRSIDSWVGGGERYQTKVQPPRLPVYRRASCQ